MMSYAAPLTHKSRMARGEVNYNHQQLQYVKLGANANVVCLLDLEIRSCYLNQSINLRLLYLSHTTLLTHSSYHHYHCLCVFLACLLA